MSFLESLPHHIVQHQILPRVGMPWNACSVRIVCRWTAAELRGCRAPASQVPLAASVLGRAAETSAVRDLGYLPSNDFAEDWSARASMERDVIDGLHVDSYSREVSRLCREGYRWTRKGARLALLRLAEINDVDTAILLVDAALRGEEWRSYDHDVCGCLADVSGAYDAHEFRAWCGEFNPDVVDGRRVLGDMPGGERLPSWARRMRWVRPACAAAAAMGDLATLRALEDMMVPWSPVTLAAAAVAIDVCASL